jgi:signal transduction histidine kinase
MKHVVPEDRNSVTAQYRNAIEKGERFDIECRIVWDDRSTHWIAARGRAYLNDRGEPIRMAGIVMEITERKQVEEALHRNRALLEAIQHAQTQFIVAEDPLGYFGEVLKSLLTLTDSEYGFIDEMFHDADGNPFLTVRAITDISWSDESRQMYHQFVDGALNFTNLKSLYGVVMESGQPVIANDAPHDPRRAGTPPGHPPLKAFLGLPLHSNLKEFVGVIGLANRPGGYTEEIVAFLDPMVAACANLIAARKNDLRRQQAERDLRRAHDELERRVLERTEELARSNAELQQFAYVASHDLQEPLRKVQTFGDMLTSKCGAALDEEGRDYLRRMQNAAGRMQALIHDLLSFARIASQAKPFVRVDLALVAQEVVSDLETRIESAGGRVDIGELPNIDGDPLQMHQLLQNLIGNGLKFHRQDAPPVVTVRSRTARPADGAVRQRFPSGLACEITVQDNGIGFEEQYLDRIFAPFQRLHGRVEYEGTGMGLAICRKIVERHGGTITARSAPGRGATFIVTVPLQQPKEPHRA